MVRSTPVQAARFLRNAEEVRAWQVGPDATVTIDGVVYLGDPGLWVVIPEAGFREFWTDPDFRARFTPMDATARVLLERCEVNHVRNERKK